VLDGAVNVVAFDPVSQAAFARAVAQAHERTVRLRIPSILIRALAGEAATILLDGQAATPRRLLAAGFRFRHRSLASALAACGAEARRANGHAMAAVHSATAE
jgi:NAD dependent epimerase/dehydratase family enzyme